MATRKKQSKPVARKSAAKRKATPARAAAAPAKRTTPKKTPPRKKTAAPPEKAIARKSPAFIDSARQLGKLTQDAPRSISRGAPEPAGAAAPALPDGFFSGYAGTPLSEQDFADAAQTLGCEVAAVKAVAEVETAGASFDASHRPTILYERHVFARNTVPPGKFNQSNPDISAGTGYPPGGYGTRDQQYVRLARAYQLDPDAALKAPSWGKFQILGENFKACGFNTVADFVRAMTISEGEHLKAFIRFLLGNRRALDAIRKKDWAALARQYNGPKYADFKYDTKLAAAYAKYARM